MKSSQASWESSDRHPSSVPVKSAAAESTAALVGAHLQGVTVDNAAYCWRCQTLAYCANVSPIRAALASYY